MKKCMKSLLSVVLCTAMLLSIVPASVLAAPQKPTAVQSGIVATKDISLTVPLQIIVSLQRFD